MLKNKFAIILFLSLIFILLNAGLSLGLCCYGGDMWKVYYLVGGCRCEGGQCAAECCSDYDAHCGNCNLGTHHCTCQTYSTGTEGWARCLWSDCVGGGECAGGTIDSASCEKCGTKTRTCSSSCTWGDWTCTGQRDCEPNEIAYTTCNSDGVYAANGCGTMSSTCGPDCYYGSWGTCSVNTGAGNQCLIGQTAGGGCQTCQNCQWSNATAGTPCIGGKCYNGQCDTVIPAASIKINNGSLYTNSLLVSLNMTASDSGGSGIKGCRYGNVTWWSAWSLQYCNNIVSFYITSGDEVKTILFEANDSALNINSTSSTITLDTIKPLINNNHTPNPKSKGQINISANATDLSGIKNISIYIDGSLVNCTTATASSCNISISYNKTVFHPYKAVAYDNARNFNESLGNFTVLGDSSKTCAENNNDSGQICAENYSCMFPGILAYSSDSKDGRCCATYCFSTLALLKCDAPPLNGIQYAPSLFSCNPPNHNLTAEVENENLSCCSGTPGSPTGEIPYWSRQNSGYFKLTEAAEGDSLYCIFPGTSGTVIFEITKPNKSPETSDPVSIENGIAKYPVLADEIGTYSCTATIGTTVLTADPIQVTEAGANPTTLPFFGIIQLLAALSFILTYHVFKKC